MNDPKIIQLTEHLFELNQAYEKTVRDRRAIPMSERRSKHTALQREADTLCRCIMQTERAIINHLLKK